MSNPIQQAIEALLTGAAMCAEGTSMRKEIEEALSALQSLQGVELPPLPNRNFTQQVATVDRRGRFGDAQTVNTVRPWTDEMVQAYARTAVAAAMARGVVPQGWLPFDRKNPPENGLMFVAVSAPETDCDVDDYGKTVGWHTGEIERTVCLVIFSADDDGEHDFAPVDSWNTGKVPAEGWITHYMPVRLPAIPESAAAPEAPAQVAQPTQAEARPPSYALEPETIAELQTIIAQAEAPSEPTKITDAMVDAYLKANDEYWRRTDQLPTPPNKWRTGTVREATQESLAAALATQQAGQGEAALLTDTDVARIYRRVYGGTRWGATEREFAKEIELAVRSRYTATPPAPQQPEALAQQEREAGHG